MMTQRDFGIRDVTPQTMDGKRWEVTVLPDRLTYIVTATGRALDGAPTGTETIGRAWSAQEMEAGVRAAVERDLVSPPGRVGAGPHEIDLTSYDLYEANGRL